MLVRKGEIGKVVRVDESLLPENWRNFVKTKDGEQPKYADNELELVTEFEKPKKASKYRELGPDEIIQKGDQAYRASTRAWVKFTCSVGYTVKDWPSNCFNDSPCKRFRRKL